MRRAVLGHGVSGRENRHWTLSYCPIRLLYSFVLLTLPSSLFIRMCVKSKRLLHNN